MKLESINKHVAALNENTSTKQICMIVDGHQVKINFAPKPESTAVSDAKRMMLGGVIKN